MKREDTLTVARSDHFAMFEWACDPEANLSDSSVVKRANPAAFVSEDFLREQIASPGLHPLEFARYHANVWTDSEKSWLPPGAWQACAGDAQIERAERVWVGVDVGGERSASAVVWLTEDLRIGSAVYQGGEAVLQVAGKVRELADTFEVAAVAYDPWRFQAPAIELSQAGLLMVEFPQSNDRMVPASERLYAAVTERRITHGNGPDLNHHVATAIARDTPRGWRLDKTKSRHQIDAVVALAMALEAAEKRPEPVQLLGWL